MLDGLVIAFDCDGTLDISGADPGPVEAKAIVHLRALGATVGICGNTEPLRANGYMNHLDFVTMHVNKANSLMMTADKYHEGRMYIFVGNTEDDRAAANEAGWIFIDARDFRLRGF